MTTETEPLQTKGLVLHSEARYYDLLAWLLTLGRERAFRERLIDLAGLKPGERVLDVGCGTGTLAIAAKQVGSSGVVVGVDASPEMIERAKRKASKAHTAVQFQTAIVERLPFPDASFDVVFNTLMLHHLPRPVREQCAREMRRVLEPNGRVVVVDFGTPANQRRGLFARLHRHGGVALNDIVELLSEAGLRVDRIGAVGVSDLQFVVASTPDPNASDSSLVPAPTARSLDRLSMPRWTWALLIVVVLLIHAIIVGGAASRLTLSVVAVIALVGAFVLAHGGIVGLIHSLLRRR